MLVSFAVTHLISSVIDTKVTDYPNHIIEHLQRYEN